MTREYTTSDIRNALRAAGVQPGDVIFSHSNIGFFGRLRGAERAEDLCAAFTDALLDSVGPAGTLVVPTFSYSYCRNQIYNPDETPSVCGMLTEYIRRLPTSIRSLDANFSVAAIGAKADELTADCDSYSFGERSIWARLVEHDALLCNLNLDIGSTFVHYVERTAGVSYRWDKPFPGTTIRNGRRVENCFWHFVRDLDRPDHEPDFEKLHQAAMKAGIVRRAVLGRGVINSARMRDLMDLILDRLEKEPSFLIKGGI